ncbi:STAS domain-containing protein [Dactylosporangium sp. AC04546]|uniref:STAS domain-containing protein n=1 Tax=Dactylosporangium sp. AC04546 TaxID=2862460 RepID=UPI001EDD5EEC|nr:STAS domain-containing protein [Dactylosporangium sp. AC04546]WVK88439.1 STAS domain-containing protein [Dactylosporangium sp. AC04546]
MEVSLALGAAVARADIGGLCAGLAERLRGLPAGTVVCDVAGVARPDVVTVEALARLRLTARRHGWRLVVAGAGPALVEVAGLLGLVEVVGEAEQREQPGRVEEVVDTGDPPA